MRDNKNITIKQYLEVNIMSKKSINFKNMTEQAINQINSFKETMVAVATESVLYSSTMKQLENKLEAIKKNRQNDLDQGMNHNEVISKYSTLKIDKEINAEKLRHKAALKPLNEELNNTYAFIPENMYAAYVRKIEDGKRGEFLNAISEFLTNLGIENSTDSQIRAMAERMSDCVGAKISNANNILEGGDFHSVLKERSFSKLFMSVFCDLYI